MNVKFYAISFFILLMTNGISRAGDTGKYDFSSEGQPVDGPTAVCQTAQFYLNSDGIAFIDPEMVDGGSFSDGSSIDSMWVIPAVVDCDNMPATDVTLWVKDDLGQTDFCTVSVDVMDNIPPTALCKDATVYLDDSGQATLFREDIDNGSFDNCGLSEDYIILPTANFTGDNLGLNDVIYMIWDNHGVTGECNATVTVVDNIPPVVNCKDTVVYLDINGTVFIDSSFVDNGSYDNVQIASMDVEPNIFDCSNVGDNIVVLTVSDQSGNTSQCNASVSVVNDVEPVMICSGDIMVMTDPGVCEAFVDVPAPEVTANCPDYILYNDYTGSDFGFGTYPAGNTVITWTLTLGNNIITCSQVIVVEDNESPEALCQDFEIALDASGTAEIFPEDIDAGSSDNCGSVVMDVAPSIFTTEDIGENAVELTVIDFFGNTAVCSATVTVYEYLGEINCLDTTVYLDQNGEGNVLPEDLIDGDPSYFDTVMVSNSAFNCDDIGVNPVVVTAVDNFGNNYQCNSNITVVDNIAPEIVCPADFNVSVDEGSCWATLEIPIPEVSDNCSVDSLINSFTYTDDASGEYPVGSTEVIYNAADASGNFTSCSFNVNVVKFYEITCPQDSVIGYPDTDTCSAYVFVPGPDIGEICEGSDLEIIVTNDYNGSNDASDYYPGGITTVNWVIIINGDPANSCVQQVIVMDSIAPELICPDDIFEYSDEGNCSVEIEIPVPDVADNCGIDSLVNDYTGTENASGLYETGITTVTYLAFDNSGNYAACSFDVEVVKDYTIVCPPDVSENTDLGMCSADVFVPGPDIGEICAGDSTIIYNDYNETDNASDNYPAGITTVTWTIIINGENPFNCTQEVIVQDVELPVVACSGLTIELNPAESITIFPEDVDAGSSDNCGIASMEVSPDTFTAADAGDNTVVLTVVDLAGNVSSCEATVTVDVLDGISEKDVTEFSFYPNPNHGTFEIVNRNASGRYWIEIIDLSGKTVYTDNLEISSGHNVAVKAGNLNKGIYLIKLTAVDDNYSKTFRMIVN